MGKFQNLEMFSINYNDLGTREDGDLDFVSLSTNCSRLKDLAIHVNRFGGVLPVSVANLSNQIKFLYMGGNRISGNIPQGGENLVMLTALHIGENLLTGEIPSSIGKLQNLGRFDFSKNDLSGEIQSAIGYLSQLFELYLDSNNIKGSVPLSLMNCRDSAEIPCYLFGLILLINELLVG